MRLACVKRAASVDSEPGSNSRLNPFVLEYSSCFFPLALLELSFRSYDWSSQISLKTSDEIKFASNQIFKDRHNAPAMFPKHGLVAGLERRSIRLSSPFRDDSGLQLFLQDPVCVSEILRMCQELKPSTVRYGTINQFHWNPVCRLPRSLPFC